jgi:hypothetical protein
MNTPPIYSFNHVYERIRKMPNQTIYGLRTTGGVVFEAKASETKDGRRFIALPHNNRIYENDWGFVTNHMGNDGQRIGHYARPLDEWCGA